MSTYKARWTYSNIPHPSSGTPAGLTGPDHSWDAVLVDGLVTIEGVNNEDVVDDVVHPNPDARLLIGPKGYATLRALASAKWELLPAA